MTQELEKGIDMQAPPKDVELEVVEGRIDPHYGKGTPSVRVILKTKKGEPFDMGESIPAEQPLNATQHVNRTILKSLMDKKGFFPCSKNFSVFYARSH